MPFKSSNASPAVLRGVRVLSLALNLPGPAALMRCRQMGAHCIKLEPPSGDPMRHYSPDAYTALHEGIEVFSADLKQTEGQEKLQRCLAQTDVLLTSFRPSALEKLGLGWAGLQQRYPQLFQVAIVGGAGTKAEQPGHDLTYLASQGLVTDLALPTSLYADMSGSLMVTEAVLKAVLLKAREPEAAGFKQEVALSDAAAYIALPNRWRLTTPEGMVGGAHAGYAVYACRDGRVAVAALEPHFACSLGRAAGLGDVGTQDLAAPEAHARLKAFFALKSREELDVLADAEDIPLLTLPAQRNNAV